ncbi:MAG: oxygenase MpaB family protein [Gemmatimonadetes bacterium]|nr:oxygenase MpaB family protein [Gemmatimonadota bacterium]
MLQVPTSYASGYEKARSLNPEYADNYIRHTMVGDEDLDPVMDELSGMPPGEMHQFIHAGLHQEEEWLSKAPEILQRYFREVDSKIPEWVDFEEFRPAVVGFHKNMPEILVAFVTAALLEGFTTLISKSFYLTGRVHSEYATRRFKQNNRHLLEIFLPGGLRREGDGYRLSARIRFVHAMVRRLMKDSDIWDTGAWGTPLSAAHVGLAVSIFSAQILKHSISLGAIYTQEERESFVKVFRYTGYIMGVPESILLKDENEARTIIDIGFMCEPPPDEHSIANANALIHAGPALLNITDPDEVASALKTLYNISRALIGHELADALNYPKSSTFGVLFAHRLKNHISRMKNLLLKTRGRQTKLDNFSQMLQLSAYDDIGMSYRLPDNVKASESSKW